MEQAIQNGVAVDFDAFLRAEGVAAPIEPRELYEQLPYKAKGYGYLRDVQGQVLSRSPRVASACICLAIVALSIDIGVAFARAWPAAAAGILVGAIAVALAAAVATFVNLRGAFEEAK
jgi:hypothetical protein